jgi:two-component system chemotaxis response regulator CheY
VLADERVGACPFGTMPTGRAHEDHRDDPRISVDLSCLQNSARLAAERSPTAVLHGDLTSVNVLDGGCRPGQVSIDPAMLLGDPAYDAMELLVWQADDIPSIQARATLLAICLDVSPTPGLVRGAQRHGMCFGVAPMPQPYWILVVDDEPSLRALTAEALRDEGYEVRTAENGKHALEMLATWTPDVIVLDIMMPVLDGWGFIEKYRKVVGADVPIIGVSAAMTSLIATRLKALGVHICLAKPFNFLDLVHWVTKAAARPA